MSKKYTTINNYSTQGDFSSFSSLCFEKPSNPPLQNNTAELIDDNSCTFNSINTLETQSNMCSFNVLDKNLQGNNKAKQVEMNIEFDLSTCPHTKNDYQNKICKPNNPIFNCIFQPKNEFYSIFEKQGVDKIYEWRLNDKQINLENAQYITKILDQKDKPDQIPKLQDSLDLNFQCSQDISKELFALIQAHTPEFVYTTFHLLNKRKSFFGIKKSFKEIMTFQDSAITSNSIIILEKSSEVQQAIRHFSVLFHQMCLKRDVDYNIYSNDEEEKDTEIKQKKEKDDSMKKIVIQYLLQLGENKSDSFINEMYTQVIKQFRSNLQIIQLFDLLNYLKCLLYCYCPSDKILLCLLNVFLIEFPNQKTWQDMSPVIKQINTVIPAILRRFQDKKYKTKNSIDVNALSKPYLDLIISNKQLMLPIFFSTGGLILVQIEQYETILDLKRKILNQLKINSTRFNEDQFIIYDVEKFENNLLRQIAFDEEYVWDIILGWENVKVKKKMQVNEEYFQFLMIQSILPFQMNENDQIAIKLNFSQKFYDIYTIYTEYFQDNKKLANIYAFLQNILKSSNIEEELPIYFTQHQRDALIPEIQNIYPKISNKYDEIQSKYNFVNIAKTSIYYDGIEISIQYCYNSSKQIYQQSSLVLKPTSFVVFDQDQLTQKQFYYKDIKQISHKDKINTIITMKNETVHNIKSNKSYQIEYIINKYQQLFSNDQLIPIKQESEQLQQQFLI